MRYKTRLVAQSFSQSLRIDYGKTYSLVMYTITFQFFISLTTIGKYDICLTDVITAYLYSLLDANIFMKISEGLKMTKTCKSKLRGLYSINLDDHYIV